MRCACCSSARSFCEGARRIRRIRLSAIFSLRCLRPACPGDPVFQRRLCLSRRAAAYWVPRLKRGMTAVEDKRQHSRGTKCPSYAAGLNSEEAALEAGLSQAVGPRLFRKAGGMPPAMFRSSAKPLSGRYLSLMEREEIALLNAQGHSLREIGRRLGRAASTISRELDRNAATHGGGMAYRATTAQWHADRSGRRPKPTKLALNSALRTYVEDRLAGVVADPSRVRRPAPKDRRWTKAWSPEQIARRLPIDFPDDETMRISHEAIYQALSYRAVDRWAVS
jgi:hypothetical protein